MQSTNSSRAGTPSEVHRPLLLNLYPTKSSNTTTYSWFKCCGMVFILCTLYIIGADMLWKPAHNGSFQTRHRNKSLVPRPAMLTKLANLRNLNNVTMIALVTEGKSGSTVLSELFNQNPSVWYLFEPLYTNSLRASENISVTMQTIYRQCNIVDKVFAQTLFWGYGSRKNRWFQQTFHSHPRLMAFDDTQLTKIRRQCSRSNVRAAKFIRLDSFTPLTNALGTEQLKIVHLVRDPRAVMASRLKKNWVTADPEDFRSHARSLCQKMLKKLKPPQFTHFHRVFYEQWVMEPERIQKEVYDFVGLKYSDSLRLKIFEISAMDEHRRGGRMDVKKSLGEWKTTLSPELQGIVTEECSEAMHAYGYSSS